MQNNQVYYQQGGGDEQYTPKYGVEVLLPHIQHLKDKIIWLPFDKEDSQFVKVLRENGFKVVYSHIEDGKDFLTYEPKEWDVLISNPPYKNKRVYWERALDLLKPFALHGGISLKNIHPRDTDKDFLMWDRDLFIKRHNLADYENIKNFKEIYVGHTTTWNISKYPMNSENVWFLDQGGGYEGRISIMDINTKEFWQSEKMNTLYKERGRL